MAQPSAATSPKSTPSNPPPPDLHASPLAADRGHGSPRPSSAGSDRSQNGGPASVARTGLGISGLFHGGPANSPPPLPRAPSFNGTGAAPPPRSWAAADRWQPFAHSSHGTPVQQAADSGATPRASSVDPQRRRRGRTHLPHEDGSDADSPQLGSAAVSSPTARPTDGQPTARLGRINGSPTDPRPANRTQAPGQRSDAASAAPPPYDATSQSRAFAALQTGARAVLLAAIVGFSAVAASAALSVHLLLPLGTPTLLTGTLLSAAWLGLHLQSHPTLWHQVAHMATTGALLGLQAAAFVTMPAPMLLAGAATSMAIGLLPTALAALPTQMARGPRMAVAHAAETVRGAVGVYSWAPAALAAALTVLGRGEALMPALTALSLAGLVLDLHGRAWRAASSLQGRHERHATPLVPTTAPATVGASSLWRDAADTLPQLSLSMGLVSWFSVQAGGTSWRRWVKRSLRGANLLPAHFWQPTTRVAHEAAPIASRLPAQLWSRA